MDGEKFDDLELFAASGRSDLNLVTDFGRFDVTRMPAGTEGYEDLRRDAVMVRLWDLDVPVASLADVIRSKQAAGRPKDLQFLPPLRRLLDEGPPTPPWGSQPDRLNARSAGSGRSA